MGLLSLPPCLPQHNVFWLPITTQMTGVALLTMNGPQQLPICLCRIYIGYYLCPRTSSQYLSFFIHFPYSDIWADIYEIEFYLCSSLFVPSLQKTYYILTFTASFSVLKLVLLNSQNPEGFSLASPTCFLHEILIAIAKCLLPEL